MKLPISCIGPALALAFSSSEIRSEEARFTHSTGDTATTVSVTSSQFSPVEPARSEFSAAGRHLGWLTNNYIVDSSSSPGDPFVVYNACYIPSNQLLLTVSGLPNYVKCHRRSGRRSGVTSQHMTIIFLAHRRVIHALCLYEVVKLPICHMLRCDPISFCGTILVRSPSRLRILAHTRSMAEYFTTTPTRMESTMRALIIGSQIRRSLPDESLTLAMKPTLSQRLGAWLSLKPLD